MTGDFETRRAEILAQRAKLWDILSKYDYISYRHAITTAIFPMPKREPKEFIKERYAYRVASGILEYRYINESVWRNARTDIFQMDLATMRLLVADADAQEKEEI